MANSDQDLGWAIEWLDSDGDKQRTEPMCYDDAFEKFKEIAEAQKPTVGIPWRSGQSYCITITYKSEAEARVIYERLTHSPPHKPTVKFVELAKEGKPSQALGHFEVINRHGVKVDIRGEGA